MSPPERISTVFDSVTVSKHAYKSSADFRSGRLNAIANPGAVKINVEGAFIVDEEPRSRSRSPIEAEGVHYESQDIRLPHHTGVVSHVAVDVSDPRILTAIPAIAGEKGNRMRNNFWTIGLTMAMILLYRLAARWRNWSILRESWTPRTMAAD